MNRKSYSYHMLGLNILSEIELMCAVGTLEEYDVRIIYDTVDIECNQYQQYSNYFAINDNEFVCDIRDVAKYKITGGNLIQIDLYDKADMELVKVYLLGTCMGVLLLQKGMIAIHGSTIVVNNQAIIITGQCGAGKSTLSTALRLKGYPILSDDISPLTMVESGKVMSVPAFPNQRICHDTAIKLGIDTSKLERACSEDFKYNLDISKEFMNHPVELFGIIQIVPEIMEDVVLTELTKYEKVELIKSNIYCNEFYSRMNYRPSYFKSIIDLANNIHTYRLLRPEGEFTVERQMELIIDVIARYGTGGKHEN
ncbi:phosphoenolpyruvate carboxykinase (ATP) [Anaeromicropila herbilytica]|uniref:HPr kinase/phosphorylase C-terminal domain-containing protein n=1 Tax=Anaeromicropila herbilytica TaxID=2785025 RepID=A0A7R7EHX3_9FIRM|nr:hypothetical protein [Anaeromicropila herbilytica]BCN29030.1 hypothetical protein bsdtb5_03250 [Anaeromicropila herbilytica]